MAPENLDWDRWIGAAQWRPYNHKIAPHDWRAWQDFGGGSLGDMACHIMDAAYMSLKLVEAPDYTVEVVEQKGRNEQTFPLMTTIKYSFPARAGMPPVAVYWYDGHEPDPATGEEKYNRPARPEGLAGDVAVGDKDMNWSFFIGNKRILTAGEYGGEPRRVPVNLLTFDQRDYLVSARGNGQWVRNVRANGGRLDLLLGRTRTACAATELADADKVPVLRAYLRRWKAEVGAFFDGVDASSTDEQILAIAAKHPVFVLDPVAARLTARPFLGAPVLAGGAAASSESVGSRWASPRWRCRMCCGC